MSYIVQLFFIITTCFVICVCVYTIWCILHVHALKNKSYWVTDAPKPKTNVPGKTIWTFWNSDWLDNDDSLHDIHDIHDINYIKDEVEFVKWMSIQSLETWKTNNPSWNVICLTRDTVKDYIDVPDWVKDNEWREVNYVRLAVLGIYGGVWVDPGVVCMMPLDQWLYDLMQPTGFWMYHNDDSSSSATSWFIASQRQSMMIQWWLQETIRDALHDIYTKFRELSTTNPLFAYEWNKTPYVWCEARGQPVNMAKMIHTIKGTNTWEEKEISKKVKYIVDHNPPFMITFLERSDYMPASYDTIQYVINKALEPKPILPRSMVTLPLFPKNMFASDKVLVVADCNRPNDLRTLSSYCKERRVQMIVYDKCNFCQHIPSDIYSRPLMNEGRENHTYLYFIVYYYDVLPDHIYFLASNLEKHPNRIKELREMVEENKIVCHRTRDEDATFELDLYENKKQKKADVRPLSAWFWRYIGNWDTDRDNALCWGGTVSTTRANIHRRPLSYYMNLLDQFSLYNDAEVGHYGERSIGRILNTDGKSYIHRFTS